MDLINGSLGKLFHAGWPPVIAIVFLALRWVASYAFGADEVVALGAAALLGLVVTLFIIIATWGTAEMYTGEEIDNVSVVSCVTAIYACCVVAFLCVWITAPFTVSVVCGGLFAFLSVLLYYRVQEDLKLPEWWGWQASLLPAGLLVAFFTERYTGQSWKGGAVLVMILLLQMTWMSLTWPSRATIEFWNSRQTRLHR